MALWAVMTVAAPSAHAQGLRTAGRVVVGAGERAAPLVGAWITLHQVTTSGGAPVDSARTDRNGRYQVRVARGDTAALYMVSAEYRGITYFTAAMVVRSWPDTVETLQVFDTSSTAPPVAVGQRHVVVRRPAEGGGRNVLELVTLVNRGDRTRIAPDSSAPVWAGRLPRGASAFQVGEGDITGEAVTLRGDRVVVTAPIPPGSKQLTMTYVVPGESELAVPLDQPADRLLVLLEDTAATLVEGPLERRGVEVFDDTPFALFDGAVPAGAGAAVFRLGSGGGLSAETVAVVVAGLAALLLAAALPLLLRRRPAAVAVPAGADTPEALARAIAALDAAFETGDRSPAAETAYRERRAALKSRLTAVLRAPPRPAR
jgi:hypothetical protein